MLCYLFLTKHRELPHGGVCPRCCANISSPKKCPRCYAIYELLIINCNENVARIFYSEFGEIQERTNLVLLASNFLPVQPGFSRKIISYNSRLHRCIYVEGYRGSLYGREIRSIYKDLNSPTNPAYAITTENIKVAQQPAISHLPTTASFISSFLLSRIIIAIVIRGINRA